jgi:hypothetical protein
VNKVLLLSPFYVSGKSGTKLPTSHSKWKSQEMNPDRLIRVISLILLITEDDAFANDSNENQIQIHMTKGLKDFPPT